MQTPQTQKIIGYDPATGKAVVGYDPNTGKMIFADEAAPKPPIVDRRGQAAAPGQDPLRHLMTGGDPTAEDALRRGNVGIGKFVGENLPTALRVGGAILGSRFGLGGSMLGAGVGELAAEGTEIAAGTRESINPAQLAVQTILGKVGATPPGATAGAARTVLTRGAQGAGIGVGGAAATELAEGRIPTLEGMALPAAVGGGLGATLGAAEAASVRRAAARPKPPAPTAPRIPPTEGVPPPKVEPKKPKFSVTLYQGRGASAADVYGPDAVAEGRAVPIFGKGQYYAPKAEDAKIYGEVTAHKVDLQNPLVISTDKQWRELLGEADAVLLHSTDSFYTQGPRDFPAATKRLQDYVRSKGYDSVVIKNTATQKRLAESFGHDQVVVFDAPPPAAKAAADVPPKVPPPPSVDQGAPPLPGGEGPKAPLSRTAEQTARTLKADIPEQGAIPPSKLVEDRMVDKFPEHLREEAKTLIAEHDGFETMRRGVQPIERQQALAEYVAVEAKKHRPGTILNAEETHALASKILTVQEQIDDLVAKVNARQHTPADLLKLAQLRADHVVLWGNELGNAAEQGRALGARRTMREALASHDTQLLDAVLREVRPQDIEDFAKKWAAAGSDIEKLALARSMRKNTWWDTFQAVRYANMLSGVKTTARNILGTSANIAFRAASKAPAVMYDVYQHARYGTDRTIFLSELAPEVVGALNGFKKGFDSFRSTLKYGISPQNVSAFDIPRPELRGGGANPFNWSGRFLEAQDAWLYDVGYHKALAARSFAEARSQGLAKGLRGKELDTFVKAKTAESLLNPSVDVAKAARNEALESLYREDGGPALQWFLGKKRAGGVGKALEFLVPFAKVPANIIRQSIENVPGGALVTQQGRAALKAGGRARAEMMGRMATGGIVLGAFAYWAAQGKVSGNGPTNPAERQALMNQGWRPNSIKIGDTWRDYGLFGQAVSTPLFAVANLYENMKETGEVPTEKDIARILFGTANSITDQSFLSSVSDLNDAMSSPERYAERFLQRQVQSIAVPFSGMQRNIAQALDPVVREPKNVVEAVKSIVPGVSTTVDPKITPFGDEATRPGTAIERGFSPVTSSTETTDPAVRVLAELGIQLGEPVRTLNKTRTSPAIELTVQERRRLGAVIKAEVNRMLNVKDFQTLKNGTADQQDRAASLLRQAIERVREREYLQIRAARRKAG